MARIITMRQALNEALRAQMQADSSVFVMGEDVAGGAGAPGEDDAWGGVYQVTKGLVGEFGRDRVVDTPISETAFLGMGIGAANAGMRPVVEIMFVEFFGVCFDQILNNAAKIRYMVGPHAKTPLTVRTTYGVYGGSAAQHSGALYPIFAHIPGIKVVIPSNPYDAKGLLIAAIRDEDPVIFFEHKGMYDVEGEVPEESYTVPFGQARVVREGGDVTIIALGAMVERARQAAENLESRGVSCEIIDPRTISPLDEDAILQSVARTGRLIVVDEAHPKCGSAAEIATVAATKGFESLKAPIKILTAPHSHVPFAPNLEAAYLPGVETIEGAVTEVVQQ